MNNYSDYYLEGTLSVHILFDMIRVLFSIGIPNDSILDSTGMVNTIDCLCNVSLRNSECPETLFSREYSHLVYLSGRIDPLQ
jgi:hypothetical protein